MTNKNWQHQPVWNGKFSPTNAAFLIITPLLSLILIPIYLHLTGWHWFFLAIFSLMTWLSSLGITAGYHRHFSHQSYDCNRIVRFFYLIFGAGALQNSALKWSSDHRYHHRFVDKEGDPYNINRGFFYAHMGWIFYKDPEERTFDNIRDLLKDPLVLWQDKYYLPIAITTGFLLPTYIGYLAGFPFGGFLFGGLFRTVFVHHGTFFINSMAHVLGSQPYSRKVTARDSWITAIFSNGEGFHNFHHVFANDYRNGIAWYHWDPSKWLIWSLNKIGFSSNLTRTPDWQIYKAKLENTHEQIQLPKLQGEIALQCHQQLESLKANIEEKIQQLAKLRREFPSRETKIRQRYFRKRLRAESAALHQSWREYKALVQLTQQLEH